MEDSREKTKYYDKQPKLLNNKTSMLKEHLQKGMTAFIVIAASLIFLFVLLMLSYSTLKIPYIYILLKDFYAVCSFFFTNHSLQIACYFIL